MRSSFCTSFPHSPRRLAGAQLRNVQPQPRGIKLFFFCWPATLQTASCGQGATRRGPLLLLAQPALKRFAHVNNPRADAHKWYASGMACGAISPQC